MNSIIKNNLAGMFSSLFEKQISCLLKHTNLNFWGNLTLAGIVVSAFYNQSKSNSFLLLWFGLILLTTFIRLYHNIQFKPDQEHSEEKLKDWTNNHILFTTLLSLLWGLAGAFLYPENLIHQVLLIVALSTVLIAAITTLAASKKVFYLQIVLLLLPVVAQLLLMKDHSHQVLALMIIVMGMMMAAVANYVHQVLRELHETQQKAQAQAHIDQVTNLANRRYFDKYFKEEWCRATREQQALSLLIIDVDHFKLYNDYNGHQAGDRCLKELSTAMTTIAKRQTDLVARYGGEEFAILLPNTSSEDAVVLAEKLQRHVNGLCIAYQAPSSLLDVVTVSIGVSSCTPRAQRNNKTGEDILYPAMLVGAADRAMYQAKENGRNRVVVQTCESVAAPIMLHKEPA